MTTYTIQITNESGFSKSYVVFMEPPGIAGGGGGQPPVFTNAWATFPGLTSGGWDSITYEDLTFAYWGKPAQSGGVQQVNTATRDSVPFQGEATVGFGAVTPGVAAAGSFQIVADPDFTAADGYVLGLAKYVGGAAPGPTPAAGAGEPNQTFTITPGEGFYEADQLFQRGGMIDASLTPDQTEIDFAAPGGGPMPSPIATFVAEPNETYTITPVERFYLTEGSYTPGEVIDVSAIGNAVIEIDFTGRAETHATIVQDAEGVLTVTYQ